MRRSPLSQILHTALQIVVDRFRFGLDQPPLKFIGERRDSFAVQFLSDQLFLFDGGGGRWFGIVRMDSCTTAYRAQPKASPEASGKR